MSEDTKKRISLTQCKFSFDEQIEIYEKSKVMMRKELALEYGCHLVTIYRIINRIKKFRRDDDGST